MEESAKAADRVYKSGYIEGVTRGKDTAMQKAFEEELQRVMGDHSEWDKACKRGGLSAVEFLWSLRGGESELLKELVERIGCINSVLESHEFRLELKDDTPSNSGVDVDDVYHKMITLLRG